MICHKCVLPLFLEILNESLVLQVKKTVLLKDPEFHSNF